MKYKPDISPANKTGHFHLLRTATLVLDILPLSRDENHSRFFRFYWG